jgi:ribonuclease G
VSDSVIVVNADGPETRVALIESGILSEFYVERERERGTVGNVYKGKVLRVLPGMQAAFVDIGEEKAAFLYAGDIAGPRGGPARPIEDDDGETVPRRTGKHADITELVRPGQEILVQVVKDPISSKGARITTYISLPGRNVVFMPTVSHIGISRRIVERARASSPAPHGRPDAPAGRAASSSAPSRRRPPTARSAATWTTCCGCGPTSRSTSACTGRPCLLYRDLNLMLRVVRDNLTPELSKVIVDDRVAHEKLAKFVSAFMPDCAQKIEQYTGREPIFDGYGIELELNRALERKVPLKSGGSLVFDQGEALTAIDVNTGKFVGAKGKTLEETITQTNIEAAEEIADQLRLRNLGGLVIIDFIDMDKESNRRKVYRKLQDVLRKDRAKAHITKISEMGLVEMSRKRTRESLGRLLTAGCESCNGKGYTKSASTVCYEILREIRREAPHMTGDTSWSRPPRPVAELMNGPETAAIDNMVKRIQRGIEVQSRKDFHIENFEIRSKNKGRGND